MAGITYLVDSVQLYVESLNYPSNTATSASASYLSVTATATQTVTGADITNTVHPGASFFANFTAVAATCTVGLNLQAKDPASRLYTTIARCSLDSITTGLINTPFVWQCFPGITSTNGVQAGQGSNMFLTSIALPRTMRVVASITATASGGSPSVSMTLGISKTMY